jgi:hypothetical protein
MKNKNTKISSALVGAVAIAIGAFAIGTAPVNAQEGVLYKLRAGETNFCHMKFPAIEPHTLDWDRPQLQDPRTGAIIDFYGSCDYDPTGPQAVRAQRLDHQRMFANEYGS